MNVQFLEILLGRLVHRKLGERPREWSYVCALSGEERQSRAEILELVRSNNPEGEADQFDLGNTSHLYLIGWANLSQCGGTEEEIISNAKKLITKVPFEKIKLKLTSYDSGQSIEDEQKQEPKVSTIKVEDV